MKNKHEPSESLGQACCGRARVPFFIAALIAAIGFSITGCNGGPAESRILTVESINIATVPAGITTVTRGVPLPFTIEILPADAPQEFTWNVSPANAGNFNAANEFAVSPALAHGTPITITAVAADNPEMVSNSIALTVYVPIPAVESIAIATVPANVTTVTRGVPLPFTVEILPADAPQEFTWNISPTDAGSFNDANEFTVSLALDHGTPVIITATAYGDPGMVSNQITLAVYVIPGLIIDIDWEDFDDRAPSAEDIDIGTINLLTGGSIVLSNILVGVENDDIRWYFGGVRIATGAILVLSGEDLGTWLGQRFVTLVVIVNGEPYSRRIAFTVTL